MIPAEIPPILFMREPTMWEPRITEPDLTRDDATFVASDDVDLARLERAMRRAARFAAGTRITFLVVERSWWRASARMPKRLSADAWRAAFASIRKR